MRLASGNYFMLFDSDCILPPEYVATVRQTLENDYVDCYGGPDSADETFTDMQLAVNYSMTSIMTTGGIRGCMKNVDKYLPRAFNMGFSREVFERTGGYLDMIGEDVDLSMRIKESGFKVRLIKDAYVYHKRRVNMKGFFKQVNTFGKARVLLTSRHPGSLKVMHLFPSCFVVGNISLVVMAVLCRSLWWLLPIAVYIMLIFLESLFKNKRLKVALLSIVTSYAQLCGYGLGYIDEFITRRASRKSAETLYRQ
jgi:GT2 family glycosyltransferase